MMNKDNFIEISAKTIEEAISLGLEKLSVSICDVDINVLEEGSKGLFGLFGSKAARVLLTLKDTQTGQDILNSIAIDSTIKTIKNEAKSAKELSESNIKAEVKAVETEKKNKNIAKNQKLSLDVENKAVDFLKKLTMMMGVEVSITVKKSEDNILFIDMHGDELGILIGRRGETLDALQYIASLVLNKNSDDFVRLVLDSENYRGKREESLVRLANRMANRAVKTGKRVSLEPMNPYERRVIHSALQGNNTVKTHSEGEEPRRHLVIVPNR